MIGVGFVGLGGMGMGQVRAFKQVKGCRVVAGADPSDQARAGFAKECPEARTYASHRDLLNDSTVDAVVLVTPTGMHAEQAVEAMKSGRPVLTEKPMGRTVADCRRMNDAAEKTGRLLMVAHCRRFDPDWGCWGKLVASGLVGRPALFRHCSAWNFQLYSQSKWFVDDKLGGGPLIDGAVHNYDFGNHLFGEPDHVIASSVKLNSGWTAQDTGTAVVHYKSGDRLMVSWSWAICGSNCIDVLGPKGAITWGPGDLQSDDLDTKTYGYYRWADPSNQKKKLHRFKRGDMYVGQARHFLACIDGKEKCLSPGTEAIKAVAVAEAILKAAPSGSAQRVKW